jgi:hypothetical protein
METVKKLATIIFYIGCNIKRVTKEFGLITRFFGFWPWSAILGQVFLDDLGGGDPVTAQFHPPELPPADQEAKVPCGQPTELGCLS